MKKIKRGKICSALSKRMKISNVIQPQKNDVGREENPFYRHQGWHYKQKLLAMKMKVNRVLVIIPQICTS